MTELEAVNQMLLTISEQPVNSLDSSGVLPVAIAKETLRDVSRSVQDEGWYFNTEHCVRLLPDEEGTIHLPTDALRVWISHPWFRDWVVQKGTKLYNKRSRSYHFDRPVVVNLVRCFDFDVLTSQAQTYITRRASRRLQEQMRASKVVQEFTQREEYLARINLQASDAEDAGYNIVHDNWPTRGAVRRDRY